MRRSNFVERPFFILLFLFCCLPIAAKPKEVTYELSCSAHPIFWFSDLSNGLIINTSCDIDNSQIHDLSQVPEKIKKKSLKLVQIRFAPDISDFFDDTFKKYVVSSGFRVGTDRSKDYTLRAKLKEFKVTDGVGSAPCTVNIEWMLMSPDNRVLLEGMAKGKHTLNAGQIIPDILDKAYEKALTEIDWNGIAQCLGNDGSPNKRADQEKNKQVKGDGDTALEHTIIRWYILSNPAGADVTWRIVSSTPDVKNTNSNFVGSTPYETTESFDIKGLTYNNSGDIQIEITCEKAGYVPQRKRFNLRQAIDQKEISAKFNLVKDSDD